MRKASVLVFPSEWYEPFGLSIIEAFAAGTPVIACELGGMAEIVRHGKTGLLAQPGDAASLAEQVDWVLSHPAEIAAMRRACREEYEAKYTAEKNYHMLMGIYKQAIGCHQS